MIRELITAINARDLPRVQNLLGQGADPAETYHSRNAYHAAATSTPDIMTALLAHENRAGVFAFCIEGKEEADPLRLAIGAGDVGMTRLLLDHGVGVNNRNGDGETPLHYAIAHRKSRAEELPVLRLLLGHGADVDAKAANYWDETPLFAAVRGSYTEAVKLLLDNGADATRVNTQGDSLLHLNANTWDADITAMLLAAGAKPESRDRQGRMPLHIAAHHNKLDVVKALLESGADPYARDAKGRIPSDLCQADFQKNTRRELLYKEMELAAIETYGPHDKYVKRKPNNRPSPGKSFRR